MGPNNVKVSQFIGRSEKPPERVSKDDLTWVKQEAVRKIVFDNAHEQEQVGKLVFVSLKRFSGGNGGNKICTILDDLTTVECDLGNGKVTLELRGAVVHLGLTMKT